MRNGNSEISVEQVAGGLQLFRTMNFLWGTKKPSDLRRLYATSDSILEIPRFFAYCTAPRSVAMQLETHKKKDGFYLWMASARPDIASEEFCRGYSREQIVRFVMTFTVRSLKEISHYRMCRKAEEPTRRFLDLWRDEMMAICPEAGAQMMPMCAYRNGLCTELRGCGKPRKYKEV